LVKLISAAKAGCLFLAMEKADLEKLIRIAETVRQMLSTIRRLNNSTAGSLDSFIEPYKRYYDLVKPIMIDNLNYQLEFYAVPKGEDIVYSRVIGAYTALGGFLDSVIKQETVTSSVQIENFQKEFFIDQNKPFTSHRLISDLAKKSVSDLKIIDNYMEDTSLDFFNNVNTKVNIKILTQFFKPNKTSFMSSLIKFRKEWGGSSLDVKETDYFHDRFIIIDNTEIWHVGSSLNRVGVKAAVISQLQDNDIKKKVISIFDKQWVKLK